MVVVDDQGAITLVNEQMEALFGYQRDEIVGQPIEILIPDRFRALHSGHRARYFQAHGTRPMGAGLELFGRRKDGREFPIEVSLSPLETETGLLVSSAIRDISERKKAEQQRAALAAIVQSSNDAIIGTDFAGLVTSWNDGARRLFGHRAEEILGHAISLIVPRECEAELARNIAAVTRGDVRSFDTVRRRKDGTLVDVSITLSPVRDGQGRIVGASKVVRDVTERRHAEQALARANKEAEAANRELEAFSYSVAHDLRAPLRGMNGFAQMLLDEYGPKFDDEGSTGCGRSC
jgi:PAS domain S-box-containing protein